MNNQSKSVKISSVILKTSTGFEYYNYDDIIRFEADRNYTIVHTSVNTRPSRAMCNLAEIQRCFPYERYYRCHKSHIINLNYVRKLYTVDHKLLMEDNSQVPVSDICLKEIKKMSNPGYKAFT